jgi:hypothetical protein
MNRSGSKQLSNASLSSKKNEPKEEENKSGTGSGNNPNDASIDKKNQNNLSNVSNKSAVKEPPAPVNTAPPKEAPPPANKESSQAGGSKSTLPPASDIKQDLPPRQSNVNKFEALPIREFYEKNLTPILLAGLREVGKER